MNGILYRIFNVYNGKSYIGKTYNSIYTRLAEHIRDSNRFPTRPLYAAMNKYGLNSFSLEILGEYSQGILEEKEIEYIEIYKSYSSKGYNATRGGEGTRYLTISDEEILNTYNIQNNITRTAKELHISVDSVRKVLQDNSIITNKNRGMEHYKSLKIIELDIKFNSILECAKFLINNNYTNTNLKSVAGSIGRAAAKKRPTYLKLTFEFL